MTTPEAKPPTGARILGVTGPVGEPGLPPSRPSSVATATSGGSQARWSQIGLPRRGIGATSSGSIVGSPGPPSRPTTAASRTHVPLAAHAFFRPMSSQRLQQQRTPRPSSLVGQNSLYSEALQEYPDSLYRESVGSAPVVRAAPGLALQNDSDRLPPPTRGTDITEADVPDRATANSTPTGAGTVRSYGESISPLHRPRRPRVQLSPIQTNDTTVLQQPSKSPRSFRSSFRLSNRDNRPTHVRPQSGHEKLASAESSPRLKRRDLAMKSAKQELGKNHQYFTGNTSFCWGGRLQNTRDRPLNLATAILIILPACLFYGFSAPWLWHHASPAIPIFFTYLLLISLSSFAHASASDPGILPRNLHPFPPPNPNEDPLHLGPATTEWTMVVSAAGTSAAMEVPTKYCKTCNIWRPPRAHHCRVCDNCIETQDHHCVWLNNCVGRRNYRYFFVFVCSTTLLGLFLFAASLGHLLAYRAQNDSSFSAAIRRWRVPFAMVMYGLLGWSYPFSLAAYHFFLVSRGETTREYLNSHKFMKKDRHRPFTQGTVLKNWLAVLQRPRPPTYLHFKRQYEQGDQRFGPRKGKRTAPLAEEQQGGGVEMQDVRTSIGFKEAIKRTNA